MHDPKSQKLGTFSRDTRLTPEWRVVQNNALTTDATNPSLKRIYPWTWHYTAPNFKRAVLQPCRAPKLE
jgi:hypothetical protein